MEKSYHVWVLASMDFADRRCHFYSLMRTLVFLFPSQNLGMGDISTFAVSEYVPAAKK